MHLLFKSWGSVPPVSSDLPNVEFRHISLPTGMGNIDGEEHQHKQPYLWPDWPRDWRCGKERAVGVRQGTYFLRD